MLLWLISVTPRLAQGSEADCRRLLGKIGLANTPKAIDELFASKRFSDLPLVLDLPLPRALENMVHDYAEKNGPLVPGQGEGVAFLLNQFYENFAKEDLFKASSLGFGEMTQMKFVAKVLKVLAPKAMILPSHRVSDVNAERPEKIKYRPSDVQGRTLVPLAAHDPAEGMKGEMDREDLSMPVMKPANGTLDYINRGDLRRQVGIGSNHFVVSIYVKDVDGSLSDPKHAPSAAALLATIIKEKKPDILFLTLGGGSPSAFRGVTILNQPGYTTKFLSEMRAQDFQQKNVIILNDLFGRTPYIHAVSNVAIIVGPINIFEPLTVRTPTIFFFNRAAVNEYDLNVFEFMAQLAQKTKGGFPVRMGNDFPKIFRKVIRSSPIQITPPYRVEGTLEIFLKHLYSRVQKQLNSVKH
jgi:hypothetical protein